MGARALHAPAHKSDAVSSAAFISLLAVTCCILFVVCLTRHFSDSSLEVFITCGHNVAFVLTHTCHDTVIRIRAFVSTGETFESRVFCQT